MRALPFLMIVLFGCTPSKGTTGCTTDSNCKGERVCQNQICVDPTPPIPPPEPSVGTSFPPAPEPSPQPAKPEAKPMPKEPSEPPSRYQKNKDGTVSDTKGSIVWQAFDSGANPDLTTEDAGAPLGWSKANQYCKQLGAGWDLPTDRQLLSLYQNATKEYIGSQGAKIKHPKEIKISGVHLWSNTPMLFESTHYALDLNDGTIKQIGSKKGFALCVRPD
jgi:hypothetical protein